MIRLLLIIAAKHFLMRLTCAEPIAIQVTTATVADGRWVAIDSAHVATVQTELARTTEIYLRKQEAAQLCIPLS